jgi:DNA-binding transcriptional LysR family regulator
MLNLRQVETFVVAAETGTLTAAGERLRVTSAAVSLAITGLEASLGSQLLIRRPARGLTLTPAGRRFLPEARELLAHAENVRAEAEADGASLTGRLSIGCYRTAAPFIVPGLLKGFGQAHPGVELDFIEAPQPELEQALLDGRCEIVIMFSSQVGPGIEMEPIYATAPYVLLAGDHPLGADEAVELRTLEHEPFVLLDVPPSGPYLLSVLEKANVHPEVRYRSSGYELCRSLVAHGLGWALLISRPHGDINYEGLPLIGRPIRDQTPRMNVGLATARGIRPTPRAGAFADYCQRHIPARIGAGVGRPVKIY